MAVSNAMAEAASRFLELLDDGQRQRAVSAFPGEPERSRWFYTPTDHGGYAVAIFGNPGSAGWGWRFAGHHPSLHYTITGGELASPTPSFFGADPMTGAGDQGHLPCEQSGILTRTRDLHRAHRTAGM